uniref:Uncharacterized protein n=1 Tax=Ditylum brightwellii TaxID=49249 RepID=A0A7S4WIT1_9STRA|mmetsp:Transcript_45997/g.69396  ORF Transcript_45997/g.69396 Transcript_45997/m.69396 type:complete len:448 (-) Transcript_45997:101-1444(-)
MLEVELSENPSMDYNEDVGGADSTTNPNSGGSNIHGGGGGGNSPTPPPPPLHLPRQVMTTNQKMFQEPQKMYQEPQILKRPMLNNGNRNDHNSNGPRTVVDMNRLYSKIITLHNNVERDRQIHQLAQENLMWIHSGFLFLPASLLTFTAGILSLLTVAEADAVFPSLNRTVIGLIVGIFALVSTFWQGVSNHLNLHGRSEAHKTATKELSRLEIRIRRCEDWLSSGGLGTGTSPPNPAAHVPITTEQQQYELLHELHKFQELHDQILSSASYSNVPTPIVNAFNLMDSRLLALLGPDYDNDEIRRWLLPLVYEHLAGIITNTVPWPLHVRSNSTFYVKSALNRFETQLPEEHEFDADGVAGLSKRQQKKLKGRKLRELIRRKVVIDASYDGGGHSAQGGGVAKYERSNRGGGGDHRRDNMDGVSVSTMDRFYEEKQEEEDVYHAPPV